MPENLCLRWNDFKDNFQSTFMFLKDDKDYADVTLASDDGQLLMAHKVVLAASSPFLERILEEHEHAHPILYLEGFQTKDLKSILEFIYQGNPPCMKFIIHILNKGARQILLRGFFCVNGVLPKKVIRIWGFRISF